MKSYDERTERILEKAERVKHRRNVRAALLSTLSCSLAAVLVLSLALFLPRGGNAVAEGGTGETPGQVIEKDPPVLSRTDDDYSAVLGTIERLSRVYETFPELDRAPSGDWMDQATVNISNRLAAAGSQGNLFACSGNVLYSLEQIHIGDSWSYRQEFALHAYALDGANSAQIASLSIQPEAGFTFTEVSQYLGAPKTEIAAAADGKSVYLFTTCLAANSARYTAVIRINTEDPHTMSVTDVHYISGEYISVRLIGSIVYVFSDFSIDLDHGAANAYLPEYGTKDDRFPLPLEDLVFPETAMRASFAVVTAIDALSGEARDALALYARSSDAYVSENNLYFTGDYVTPDPEIPDTGYSFRTELVRVPLRADGTLTVAATGSVKGSLTGASLLDESEGKLRLFSTVKIPSALYAGSSAFSVSLYVLDAETLTVRGAKEAFAEEGAGVRSARFDGDLAYACTGDRVAGFRLGDEIVPLDTEGMPAAYTALAGFGENLVGVGYTDTRANLTVTVYERAGGEIARFQELGLYPTTANAYLVDGEHGLVGLGFTHLDEDPGFGDYMADAVTGTNVYLLLVFEGGTLHPVRIPIAGEADEMRAAFDAESGYLYVTAGSAFEAYKVF